MVLNMNTVKIYKNVLSERKKIETVRVGCIREG